MYNEEIKRRFIDDFSKENQRSMHAMPYHMSALSKAEEFQGKDIAAMSFYDAKVALEKACISEVSTLMQVCSVGRAYVKWCKDHGLFPDSDYGFLNVYADDIDMTETLRRVLFKDEHDLLGSITLVHSLDDGYVDVPALVLAWLGVPKDLLLKLKDENVNLQNRVITDLNGEVLVSGFSDQIHDALHRFVECRTSVRENGRFEVEVVKDRSTTIFLKKMVSRGSAKFGVPHTPQQLNSQLNKLSIKYEAKGFPARHSYTNAFRSGRFYELWLLEQSGVDVLDPKNRAEVERVFRNKKNYYNAVKMYRFYKRAFWSDN